MGMWTSTTRPIFSTLAIALTVTVACAGGLAESTLPAVNTVSPTMDQVVGVRGATGLNNPVFPSFGNGGYDVSHYDLDLAIDPDANTLDGVATIQVIATEHLLTFNFDFAGPAISAVQVNDEPATFTQEDHELIVEPATIIPNGSKFTVRVTYGGTPEPLVLQDIPFAMGWTLFQTSVVVHGFGLAWYPNNQTPVDKATYTMRLTVPNPLAATATGELTNTVDNGDTSTYIWEVRVPVDGVAFAVSDSVLETIPGPGQLTINNYFPSNYLQFNKDQFGIVSEVIELFIDLFGPFPYDSFGITFLRGGLPRAGFAPPGRAFLLSANERLIAHEISHQWFGGSVTPASPSDNWLAEGFATYAEILWVEHAWGADTVTGGARSLQREIGDKTRPPAVAISPADILDPAVYVRGGLTLHALRLELGDEDFFEVMRTFVDRFKYSAASTADFIAVAEEIGQRDLGKFFDDWLYSEPVPTLDL